jgi:hypothetical protein
LTPHPAAQQGTVPGLVRKYSVKFHHHTAWNPNIPLLASVIPVLTVLTVI